MPPVFSEDLVHHELWRYLGLTLVLAFFTVCVAGSSASAAWAVEEVQPTLVQTIATSSFGPPGPDPAGIVYMAASDRFLISDSEVDEMTLYQGANLFTATRSGAGTGTGTTLGFSLEPTGLGYNPNDGTLYVSDDDADRISVVRQGPDNVHGTLDDVVTGFSTAAFGSTDAEGIEYDPATGHLFVCDGAGLEVYRLDPVNGAFGDGHDVVTSFDLARYGSRDCEGIGLDAQRDTLLAVDPRTNKIYELTKSGDLLRTVELSSIPATSRNVASVTMAPTSNPGDSPSAMNYWVVDRQVDNDVNPNENDGLLYELAVGSAPAGPTLPAPAGPALPAHPHVPLSARLDGAFADCPTSTANVIRGSSGNDSLTGTLQGDRIFADRGNDVVDGLAEGDCIDLGPGADRGQGGFGADRLLGQSGSDRLSGERGRDRINGGSGNDQINGGSGNDSINGNSGRDRLKGSSGRDRISGGSGDDRVSARDGKRDRVNCGSGLDRVAADRVDRVARDCERMRLR